MANLTPYHHRKNGFMTPWEWFNDDNWMSNFLGDEFFGGLRNIRADIAETKNAYVVEADMPGLKKEQIDVSLNDHVLTISAQMDDVHEESEEGRYIRRERRMGTMQRSFRLNHVDEKGINAEYKDGVLRVTLPKASGGSEPQSRIPIQ